MVKTKKSKKRVSKGRSRVEHSVSVQKKQLRKKKSQKNFSNSRKVKKSKNKSESSFLKKMNSVGTDNMNLVYRSGDKNSYNHKKKVGSSFKNVQFGSSVKNKILNSEDKKEKTLGINQKDFELKEGSLDSKEDVEHSKGVEQSQKKVGGTMSIGGKVIERYSLEVDGTKANIEIIEKKNEIFYRLVLPEIQPASKALLDEIRDDLIMMTTINANEIVDPEAFVNIKKRFRQDAQRLIEENLKSISKKLLEFLAGRLMLEMLGLGELEFLINDVNLEEIVIPSSKEPIRVYYKKHGWVKSSLQIGREEEILNYSDIVARRVGRQITVLSPLLDAHLVSGDRVNAVLYPINTKGNTITIRKFARNPLTIIDLIKSNSCSIEVASLLWMAIEYEMNVIISGGTASGKTSFLNACLPFIPPKHRIISIEDTRELMLPDFLYWTPLVTRTPNPEGKGGITMLDLLVNSLRMRPDRIILGEMRKEEEARVLFEAMHTGHSVYATLHADSAAETISRLINPPLNVPPNLLKSVNLNVVLFRDRKSGKRRVFQVAEFDAASNTAHSNLLYRWVPEKDEIIGHGKSMRLFEDLSRNTGMSESQINESLDERKQILSYLLKENINKLQDFGKVINFYYQNKDDLLNSIRKNNLKKFLNFQ